MRQERNKLGYIRRENEIFLTELTVALGHGKERKASIQGGQEQEKGSQRENPLRFGGRKSKSLLVFKRTRDRLSAKRVSGEREE